jgi:Flp pilus assembly protein TadD
VTPADLKHAASEACRSGDLAQALTLLRQAILRAPDDVALRVELAECLWADYDFEAALRAWAVASEKAGTNPNLCAQVAQKLFSLGRFAPSAAWLEKAIALAPRDAGLRVMLGEVYERCDRLDEAERQARAALALDSASVKAIRLLAHVERRRGSLESARKVLSGHLEHQASPEDWRLCYELAAVLDGLGDYEQAMQVLLRAKEQLRPQSAHFLAAAQAVRQRQLEVVASLTVEDFRRWSDPLSRPGTPTRLAFLCGHPRSGTTLLEQILSAHPDVVSTDETGVWQREFVAPILRQPTSVEACVAELRAFTAEQLAAGREAYLRFTTAHLGQRIDGRLLVEKDPSLTPDLPLPVRLFPEAKVIFPMRDARDICVSYFFTIVPLNTTSVHALDLAATAEFCAHSFQCWKHWREVLACPWLETRYEQLVAQPTAEARRTLEFLGLPWDDRVLRFYERSFRKGIRTPTYADVGQPIYARSVGRWKNYAKYLEPCLRMLEPVLEGFGYR